MKTKNSGKLFFIGGLKVNDLKLKMGTKRPKNI